MTGQAAYGAQLYIAAWLPKKLVFQMVLLFTNVQSSLVFKNPAFTLLIPAIALLKASAEN